MDTPAHVTEAIQTKKYVGIGALKVAQELEFRIEDLGAGNAVFYNYSTAVKIYVQSDYKPRSDLAKINSEKSHFDGFISRQNLSAEIKDEVLSYSAALANLASAVIDKMPRSSVRNDQNKYRELEDIGMVDANKQNSLIANYIDKEKEAFKRLANHRT